MQVAEEILTNFSEKFVHACARWEPDELYSPLACESDMTTRCSGDIWEYFQYGNKGAAGCTELLRGACMCQGSNCEAEAGQ